MIVPRPAQGSRPSAIRPWRREGALEDLPSARRRSSLRGVGSLAALDSGRRSLLAVAGAGFFAWRASSRAGRVTPSEPSRSRRFPASSGLRRCRPTATAWCSPGPGPRRTITTFTCNRLVPALRFAYHATRQRLQPGLVARWPLDRVPPEPAGAGRSELRLIPPLGGPDRKLADIHVRGGITPTPPYLTWCPDGSCLIATDSPGEGAPDALFVIPLETRRKAPATHPAPPASGDINPAVSPDGSLWSFAAWPACSSVSSTSSRLGMARRRTASATANGRYAECRVPDLDA